MLNNIIQKPIDSLIFAEYNPRQLSDDQYKHLKDSISRFGLVDPIIINKNKDRKGIIIGGHQRVKVARTMGIKEVTCVEIDLVYDKERELNVRLNKNTGSWDFDVLANTFDIDELLDWGFEEKELQLDVFEEEKDGLIDDDTIPEDVESVCKLGDLWQLGEHRLLCGDSTKKENIELLLDGNKADMVFTDPPYGIGYSGDKYKNIKPQSQGLSTKRNKAPMIIGDDREFDPSFILELFKNIKEVFIWGFQYYPTKLGRGGVIVWNKKVESQKDCAHGDFELCWSKQERNKMYWLNWGGFKNKEKNEKRLHTTQKPIELCKWFVDKYSNNNSSIIDIFLGSGSTLIACEKTNRKCYGMELDENYCDVIIERWEQFTGKKAELLNGKTKEI